MDISRRGWKVFEDSDTTPSESLERITSTTTLDLYDELQDSAERLRAATLPILPLRAEKNTPSAKKKRDRDQWLASSSDAPMFSSDDLLDPSYELYIDQHRHKRLHRGPWYEEERGLEAPLRSPRRKPRPKGPFTRNFDSGVWLGSDVTTASEEAEAESDRDEAVLNALRLLEKGGSINGEDVEPDLPELNHKGQLSSEADDHVAIVNKALQTTEDPEDFDGPVYPYWQKQPDRLERFHAKQKAAQKKVLECVETGGEVVDLSSMSLQQIRTPTLKPLRYYTTQSTEQDKLKGYHRLTPALCLYLSNNLLEDLPGEVYKLTDLAVLSLRSNNLTELSPSIGRLTGLRELNLGSNQLNWIPWELLDLLRRSLKKCMLYPNPFLRPLPSLWDRTMPLDYKLGPNDTVRVASTRVAFLGINGESDRNWPPPPTSLPEHWPESAEEDKFLGPLPQEQTKTPSLLEIALRACYKSPQLSQLPFLLPEDSPPYLAQLLKTTFKLKEGGGINCSELVVLVNVTELWPKNEYRYRSCEGAVAGPAGTMIRYSGYEGGAQLLHLEAARSLGEFVNTTIAP